MAVSMSFVFECSTAQASTHRLHATHRAIST
jgi:hypothetical protein